jgi:hypothetical protein
MRENFATSGSFRSQSHIVGFVLILGLSVVALGTLTLSVGTVMDSQSTHADTTRVATEMDESLSPTERTGVSTHRLTFAEGTLETTDRTLRVLAGGSVIHEIEIDALVFESGERHVRGVAGAVVHDTGSSAWLEGEPPITSSEANEVLVVGVPVLDTGDVAVTGNGGATVRLQSNVTHNRTMLGEREFTVAIETATPEPLESYFEAQNARTDRRTFPGDDHESIVATFPGERTGYLVVHNLALEVESE